MAADVQVSVLEVEIPQVIRHRLAVAVKTRTMWQSITKALKGKKQKRSNQEG